MNSLITSCVVKYVLSATLSYEAAHYSLLFAARFSLLCAARCSLIVLPQMLSCSALYTVFIAKWVLFLMRGSCLTKWRVRIVTCMTRSEGASMRAFLQGKVQGLQKIADFTKA